VIVFILRRLLLMIPTTLGVAAVVFTIFQLAPGDPATVMMGMGGGGEMSGSSDAAARKRAFEIEHGLDRHPVVQFLDYIGPFNLSRDGHPWFDSPYTERTTEDVVLADGRRVVEGAPLRIDFLHHVAVERRVELEVLATTLRDTSATAEARADAEAQLASAGVDALPAVLTGLQRQTTRADDHETLRRLDRLAGGMAQALTGERVSFVDALDDAARGPQALIRGWFGWYYTEGGGSHVRNTGEKPWGGLLLFPFTFDLGREIQNNKPVAEELAKRLAVTVPLSLMAVLISYCVALPLGIFSARRQGTLVDSVVTVGLFVLYSIPTFWFGLMLIILFGKTGPDWWWWPELPVIGLHDADAEKLGPIAYAKDYLLHIVLPVATLSYGSFAYLSRLMRSGMLDVIRQDFIRTARAKGLSEKVVVYKHTLRNSLIPVITLFASVLPVLIGGSVIVEKVFQIPGMGMYAFEGLIRRDFNIIMATTIFVGIMTQIGILMSDIAYTLVDPRIRHE
jgi:peptide/nickel transport system permease protein